MRPTILALLLAMTVPLTAFSSTSPPVREDHPRLLFRAQSEDSRTVTLEMIRKRVSDPRYERFRQGLYTSSFIDRGRATLANLALRAVAWQEDAAADSAIADLQRPLRFTGETWDGIRVLWAAFALDWLWEHPNFDQAEKDTAIETVAAGAERLYGMLRGGSHVFHTRMYGWTCGLAAAGIALSGHHPEAEKYFSFAYDYFRNDLLPSRHLQGGSVHNGFGYGRHYTMWLTGHYLAFLYTATGEDLWAEIREHQDDWAAREAEFIIYGRQPDGLMAKFGDCYRRTSERFSFRVIAERNWFYREPVFQGYLQRLLAEQTETVFERGNEYIAFLYYEPSWTSAPESILPGRTVFGRWGTGMVFWRGWQPDDTWIFFKCGDYFENHGHYDQGHVEIFRSAPLLAEAGAYVGGFDSDFRMNFYRRSVSHNTLLITDPGNPDDIGDQRVYMNQSLGTMDRYLADLGAETGDIIAYSEGPETGYVMADLTRAYSGNQAHRVTRELALVGDRYLLVVDRVALADSRRQPRALWHCPVRPEIYERGFAVRRGGSRVVFQLLAPDDARLEWVEGFRAGAVTYELPGEPGPYNDPGVGRMEVVGVTGKPEHLFIQAMDIASDDVGAAGFVLKEAGETVTVGLPDGRTLRLTRAGAELR